MAAHYSDLDYLGLDFSEALLDKARTVFAGKDNIHFQAAAMPHMPAQLAVKPPFNLITITALFLYLNDADVEETVKRAASLARRPSVSRNSHDETLV